MLAVIGGTGIYELAGMQAEQRLDDDTPFGRPSGPIVKGRLAGRERLFLARRGAGHRLLPNEVNDRASLDRGRALLDALLATPLPEEEPEIRGALQHGMLTPDSALTDAQREWLAVLRC